MVGYMLKKIVASSCILLMLSGYSVGGIKCLIPFKSNKCNKKPYFHKSNNARSRGTVDNMLAQYNPNNSRADTVGVNNNDDTRDNSYYNSPQNLAFLEAIGGKNKVYFAFDKYNVSAESEKILEIQGEWLKRHPNAKIIIEGHCDQRGTRDYNIALGKKRADAVKQFLIELGVKPENIETTSYGKDKPAAEAIAGKEEEAYALNRRTVTVIRK